MAAASEADLDAVMRLYWEARSWHEATRVDVWKRFDRAQVARDIAEGRVFVAKAGGATVGTVTLLESDVPVWGRDDGKALYIHKLASSRDPVHRGIGARILQWVREFATEQRKERLRLDTWNENPGMRRYYESQGFRHVGDRFFPVDSPLPEDYRGTYKSLFELQLK